MEKNKGVIPWGQIQGWMASSGLTQSGLARRLNVATNVVTNWKRRGGAPFGRAAEIALALKLPVMDLLEGAPVSRRMKQSRAAQRIVDRVVELDRRGNLAPEVEAALHAVLDLAVRGKGRD